MLEKTERILWILIFVVGISCQAFFAQTPTGNPFAVEIGDSVVTILRSESDGVQASAVGSGLVVRSDGYVLTAHHLVKNAREIQIRFRNGEVFDKAAIVATDERRNVALLRVNAAGLRVIPGGAAGATEENLVGTKIFVVSNSGAAGQSAVREKLLNAVRLADGIPGAGGGFRVLQFDAIAEQNSAGGLVMDERGRSLGIITTNPNVKNQNIAVPLSSVVGLINAAPLGNSAVASSVYTAASSPTADASQRSNISPETRKVFSTNPRELLLNSKIISVNSRTTFFKEQQLINELLKRDAIKGWGWLFLDGSDWDNDKKADLIIELDHQIFTYNFTFTIRHRETSIVLAAGKVIIADGASGAPLMVDRMLEKLLKAREEVKTPNQASKDKKTE